MGNSEQDVSLEMESQRRGGGQCVETTEDAPREHTEILSARWENKKNKEMETNIDARGPSLTLSQHKAADLNNSANRNGLSSFFFRPAC